MAKDAPELIVHKEWLGQIQQVGLVVSPFVLVRRGVGIDKQKALDVQRRIESIAVFDEDDDPRIEDFATFAHDVLDWPSDIVAEPAASLSISLPEHEDVLTATYAVMDGGRGLQPPPLALIAVVPDNFDSLPEHHKGWRATPHARLERLLREAEIPIGLLYNGRALRLVYAPRGESSGHLTFRLKDLLHTQGRPMAGALAALLGGEHFTGVLPDERRLPALLKESRKFQNEVSTKLAGQVLEALWELLRGFQRANEETGGRLLADVLREDKNDVYGGLLSTLMRLVFILYAEDRGLMPQGEVYQNHYSLLGLFKRLQDDETTHIRMYQGRLAANYRLIQQLQRQRGHEGEPAAGFPADRANFAAELLGFVQEVGVDKYVAANYPQQREAYLTLRMPFFTRVNVGEGAARPQLAVYHSVYRLLRAQLGLLVASDGAARNEIEKLRKECAKQLCQAAKKDLLWINKLRRAILNIRVDTEDQDPEAYSELFDRVMAIQNEN